MGGIEIDKDTINQEKPHIQIVHVIITVNFMPSRFDMNVSFMKES